MSTTTIDRPRTRQPESEDDRDPMEQYYGRDAWTVAKELFGEDFKTPGMFFSDVDDVPHKVEGTGSGFSDTNLLTGKPAGGRGFDGVVVSQAEAQRLISLSPRAFHIPAKYYQTPPKDSGSVRSDNDSATSV